MDLISIENLFTLAMLILLQAVLGFDNLLYISIESNRVEASRQVMVRRLGIGLAVALRIILLFALIEMIKLFQDSLFALQQKNIIEFNFNLHSLIVLLGGVFILYTAIKEILHMMSLEDITAEKSGSSSFLKTLLMIVAVNAMFSFDSILSAMAITDHFVLMALSIVIGGVLMIWLSDHVAEFLAKNRMYEVVGLFILFVVGILLISEGGHLAHLKLFGYAVEPMSKTTFYFVIAVIIVIDIVQSRYANRLNEEKKRRTQNGYTESEVLKAL